MTPLRFEQNWVRGGITNQIGAHHSATYLLGFSFDLLVCFFCTGGIVLIHNFCVEFCCIDEISWSLLLGKGQQYREGITNQIGARNLATYLQFQFQP